MKQTGNDMTQGKALKPILLFTIPMLIGAFFQQFYNIIDMLIVGNAEGSRALAAIGATASTTFFLLSLTMGLSSAFTTVLSQFFGAKREDKVKTTLVSSMYITFACIVILMVCGIFGAQPLMKLLQTPSDIIEEAVIYVQICIGGCAGLLIYNGVSAILRAVGDSKTPLYFLILSSLLNVVLDLLFVWQFKMGVAGVGIATVLAQSISGVLCVVYMFWKYPIFRIGKADLAPDTENIRMIVRIGVPMGIQMILCSIGEMVISAIVNGFGTDVVAAFATCNRVQQFATIMYLNISQAFAVFAGQNLGAQKIERIKSAFKSVTLVTVLSCFISTALIFMFGDQLIRWFISDGDSHIEAIVEIGRGNLRIGSCFYVFLGLIWLYNNTLRGMGDIAIPLASGMVELVAKVALSFLLAIPFGYVGVWFANPIGWALGLILPMIRYHNGSWMTLSNKIIKQEA